MRSFTDPQHGSILTPDCHFAWLLTSWKYLIGFDLIPNLSGCYGHQIAYYSFQDSHWNTHLLTHSTSAISSPRFFNSHLSMWLRGSVSGIGGHRSYSWFITAEMGRTVSIHDEDSLTEVVNGDVWQGGRTHAGQRLSNTFSNHRLWWRQLTSSSFWTWIVAGHSSSKMAFFPH